MSSSVSNSFPVKHVVVSASHDKMGSPAIADSKIMAKAQEDLGKNKDCVSYNFRRAQGQDPDENKFLMPLFDGVPVLAFTVMPALSHGCSVAVVGSREVETVIEALNDHLQHFERFRGRRIRFAYEGDRTSLPNSIISGADALDIDDTTPFMFVAGDIPFFMDYHPLLSDRRIIDNVAVYSINSKQHMFPDGDVFIPRNFYHVIVDEEGRALEWKESNTPVFTKGIPFLKDVSKALYANRQGGAIGAREFAGLLLQSDKIEGLLGLPDQVLFDLLAYAGNEVLHKFGRKKKPQISRRSLEQIASVMFGGPFAVQFGDDVWRMKDIDAWHDLFFYQHIVSSVKQGFPGSRYSGLDVIIEDADVISSFDCHMNELKGSVGVLRDFRAYANSRAIKQDRPLPYDDNGLLAVPPAPGEDIRKSIEHLIRYKKKSMKGKETYFNLCRDV
jgi:hypothetical protein